MLSRSEMVSVAKELGLWGSVMTSSLSNQEINDLLHRYRPHDLGALSTTVRRFYGGDCAVRAPSGTDAASAPASVAALTVSPLAPHSHVEPEALSSRAPVLPPPVAPASQPLARTPLPAVTHAPPVGMPPAPPALGAARAFDGADLARLGLVAIDCPGSIVTNNAVCLICGERDACLDQALDSKIRYPDRWKPELPQEVPLDASSEVVAAAQSASPLPPAEPRASSSPSIQAPVAAPAVDAPFPTVPPAVAGFSKVGQSIVALGSEFGWTFKMDGKAIELLQHARTRLRMSRVTQRRPVVLVFLPHNIAASTVPGMAWDEKRKGWLWDGRSAHDLEVAMVEVNKE